MLQEYQTQNELNPKLWIDGKFNEKLRSQLLRIADAFYKFLGIDAEIKDVTLTGSNANYNWTKHSDIDLHLIINYYDINDNFLLVRELMQAKKSIWNNTYPIKYKGMNIELYAQDSNEPHTSTGVYSLFNDEWVKKPEPDVVSIEDAAIDRKADPYKYEIDELDPYEDNLLDKIKNLKSRLKQLRQTGLESVGEYSIENLAFKSLRNSGHLEKLSDLEKDITLIQLTPSLDEQWPKGPFGERDSYSNYGGPFGDPGHKTNFKKGPGKTPTKSIGHGRSEEEKEDDDITGYKLVNEDPKKGTGKKPKGSGRRLYTDENPDDTVSVKFKTKQDVVDTLNKSSFKSKSHKRQSQIINLIHQRLRVAVERTKDPEKKKRLKTAYEYIKKRKEASKEKTKRLKNELKGFSTSGSGSRYRAIEKRGDKYYFRQDNPFRKGIKQEFGPYDTKAAALKKMNSYPPAVNYRDISDGVEENFADGKNPGRKGLSKKVGVSQKMSIAKLEKIAKTASGERKRMAQWNLNMKRGRNKKKK